MWILAYADGCMKCRRVADIAKRESGGAIEVASLRDQRVTESVQRCNGRTNRPALLDTDKDGRVLQGVFLWWGMVRLVGVRRALAILRAIGGERQRPSNNSKNSSAEGASRRGFMVGGGKVVLGSLVAGGLLSVPGIAHADTLKSGSTEWRRLRGSALANAREESVASSKVLQLIRTLKASGYEDFDRLKTTAVAVSDAHGKSVTWLPAWHPGTETLAIISCRFQPEADPRYRVFFLQKVNGRIQNAKRPPAANDPVVTPAIDWSCWSDCVGLICPACAEGCIFTGPLWPECVLDCCGAGLAGCTAFC